MTAPLEVDVLFGDRPELRLRGELDAGTARAVADAVNYAVGAGHPDVVIDAASVTYCDAGGIAALVDARTRSGSVTLRAPSKVVRRALAAADLERPFEVET